MVNTFKMAKVHQVVTTVGVLQNAPFAFECVDSITQYILKAMEGKEWTDKELYDKSLELEPRDAAGAAKSRFRKKDPTQKSSMSFLLPSGGAAVAASGGKLPETSQSPPSAGRKSGTFLPSRKSSTQSIAPGSMSTSPPSGPSPVPVPVSAQSPNEDKPRSKLFGKRTTSSPRGLTTSTPDLKSSSESAVHVSERPSPPNRHPEPVGGSSPRGQQVHTESVRVATEIARQGLTTSLFRPLERDSQEKK